MHPQERAGRAIRGLGLGRAARTGSVPPPEAGRVAPPAPPGWRSGPPDYVGVGAPLSGAAWWDGLIAAHSRVARAPGAPREVRFFDGRWAAGLDAADVLDYHARFARPEGALAGEWTATYMSDPWVPPLLHRAAPDARLLVLLRDPVERFHRGWAGPEHPSRTGATIRAAANAAFGRGAYADALQRLWACYPRKQVLVLQYERCRSEPLAELRRTFEFLELDPSEAAGVDPSATGPDAEAGAPPSPPMGDWQERTLVERYAPENERLATLVPGLDLSLWRMPA